VFITRTTEFCRPLLHIYPSLFACVLRHKVQHSAGWSITFEDQESRPRSDITMVLTISFKNHTSKAGEMKQTILAHFGAFSVQDCAILPPSGTKFSGCL
jgi:hypothetical protein